MIVSFVSLSVAFAYYVSSSGLLGYMMMDVRMNKAECWMGLGYGIVGMIPDNVAFRFALAFAGAFVACYIAFVL